MLRFFFPNTDIVTEESSSWILKETGVCITFSSKAVPDPRLDTSSLWRPGTVSPPLEDNEIATDLGGYELVMKELTNAEDNVWKDLETWCPSDPLSGNSESQSELRFAQAKITSSLHVRCDLASQVLHLFTSHIRKQSRITRVHVQSYPDVSVTIPTRSLPLTEGLHINNE
ncbi:hypothetical protein OS493_038638, partial [Desmophyllum pertusum]